jgi:hypothetical protein
VVTVATPTIDSTGNIHFKKDLVAVRFPQEDQLYRKRNV